MKRTLLFLLVVSLVAAACGDTTAEDGTVADVPPVAGACSEDDPDCDDTPADGGGLPLADDGGADVDLPADGGLTVAQALSGDTDGIVGVQGFLLGDESGWRLCEALAESFPPQCGGLFLDLADSDTAAADAFIGEYPIEEGQATRWTNDTVVLFGEVVGASLVIDFGA